MKNTLAFYGVLACVVLLSACQYFTIGETDMDVDIREYNEAFTKVTLNTCDSARQDLFFYATFDGKEVCYNEGEDNYAISGDRWSTWTTSGPGLSNQTPVNGYSFIIRSTTTIPNLSMAESFRIETPIYDVAKDSKKAFEDFFYTGALLPIRDNSSGVNEAFSLSLVVPYKADHIIQAGGEGNRPCKVSTIFGPKTNGFLKVDEVIRDTEDSIYYYYYVYLSFECDLFFDPMWHDEGVFAHVRNGQMVAHVKVVK